MMDFDQVIYQAMLQTCPCAIDLSLQHGHSLCHIYIYISWTDLITTALGAAETLQMLLEAACTEDRGKEECAQLLS